MGEFQSRHGSHFCRAFSLACSSSTTFSFLCFRISSPCKNHSYVVKQGHRIGLFIFGPWRFYLVSKFPRSMDSNTCTRERTISSSWKSHPEVATIIYLSDTPAVWLRVRWTVRSTAGWLEILPMLTGGSKKQKINCITMI